MLQKLLDLALSHGTEILLSILTVMIGVGLRMLRQLPAVLHKLALELKAAAEKTPGPADDVAARLLLMFADALAAAFAQKLPEK